MSQIDSISQLMLGLGNVRADEARQIIAQQELERQNKHAALKGTLRILGTIAPLFIPGAPLAGLLGSRWAGLATSPFEKALMGTLTGANALTQPSRVGVGNTMNPLSGSRGVLPPSFGPMGRDDWYQTPWDEEGVG